MVIVAIGAAARGRMQTRVSATGIPFHVPLLLTRPLMHLTNSDGRRHLKQVHSKLHYFELIFSQVSAIATNEDIYLKHYIASATTIFIFV